MSNSSCLNVNEFLVVCSLYSFAPLTPPKRWASRDIKDNANVLSDFDPAELTFTQSQHNLNLNNLNALTSSTPSVLSTGSVTAPTPLNASILGASVQRKESTTLLPRGDSRSMTGRFLHHRDSSSQLHSQLVSIGIELINPSTNSTIPANGFNLSQSLNFGTRPGLHFSSPTGEGEGISASPVAGSGNGTVDDDVPKSNAKSVYKLCHRGSCATR